jgi:hypothetical protein
VAEGTLPWGSPCALDMTAAICLLSSSLSWLRFASMPAGITEGKGLPAPPAPAPAASPSGSPSPSKLASLPMALGGSGPPHARLVPRPGGEAGGQSSDGSRVHPGRSGGRVPGAAAPNANGDQSRPQVTPAAAGVSSMLDSARQSFAEDTSLPDAASEPHAAEQRSEPSSRAPSVPPTPPRPPPPRVVALRLRAMEQVMLRPRPPYPASPLVVHHSRH